MAQPQPPTPRMSFEEFVIWTRHRETRYEFIDGVPVAMAGGTEA